MKYFYRQFIFAIILSAVSSLAAFSQSSQNNLKGRITDSNNAGLAGAKVVARNQASGEQFSVQTDDEGNFDFQALPNGKYRLTVESRGFSSASREISLEGNPVENQDFTLSAGNINENLTVTATRTQVATSETAVPVSVVTRETIEEKNVNTIGDIFRGLPGTSTVNEGAFQVRPRIRGLDSNRVLVLVDGERLNNGRTSTDQSGIELGLVATEQIETLEVVRGSGSVLYGTDALAGTVNIITKDAPRNLDGGWRFGATFNGFFSSNETGRRGSLAVTGSSKFFSFRVTQSLERYGNYSSGAADFLASREVGNSQSHGSNTQITTRFFLNDNNDLRLNYERRRAGNIGSPTLTLESGFNAFFPFSNRDKFSGRFETRNISKYLARVSVSGYFQKQDRNFSNILFVPPFLPFFPGINNFSETITKTDSYGFDLQSNWLLGNKNFLTAGISFFRDHNKDSRFIENRIPVVTEDRSKSVPNADFGSVAAFAQDEFELTNRLKFIGGIRLERFSTSSSPTEGFGLPASLTAGQIEDLGLTGLENGLKVSQTAVTGDFGAVYKLTGSISLTGRLGRSFRMANLFERFFTGAGSIGGFVVGNPNLKPESGLNFDAGIKVQTSKYAASLTYFNNYYRNFLSNELAFDRNGQPITIPGGQTPTDVYQTVNIGRARIQGFEADFEMPFRIGSGFLTPSGNVSYLHGDDLETGEPLNTISPLRTVLNIRWQNLRKNYFTEWTTRIVTKQERLSTAFLQSNGGAEPGFAVSDIRGGYTFKRDRYRLSVNVSVTNLFNRYYREQFFYAPARGRSFVLGTIWEL